VNANLLSNFCISCFVCIVGVTGSHAQNLRTLFAFNFFNGEGPYRSSLLPGKDGNLYGTTTLGGISDWGTVFEITPSGKLSTLYNFRDTDEVSYPVGRLVQTTDGTLYGAATSNGPGGAGAIYRLTLDGHLTLLHQFCGNDGCLDGANPEAGLIEARDHNFYGTAEYGGAYGGGVVYGISRRGKFRVLHSFCTDGNCADGKNPTSELVQASDGTLYGTTYYGGNGAGVIFKIGSDGTFSVVHAFGSGEGSGPSAGLVQASDGNLYGTTQAGGETSSGTIFRMTPEGVLTTLYNFDFESSGAAPLGTLLQASDSYLYGTTSYGSPRQYGTVFRLTLDGTFETLHQFELLNATSWAQGAYPDGGLVQGTNGKLYGTTYIGGLYSDWCFIGCGTLYSVDIDLSSSSISVKPH